MKILDTVLFSFATLCMLIGIHQAMTVGYAASYWLFMLAGISLLWYQTRKKNRKKEEEAEGKKVENQKKTSEASSKKRKYKI